MSLFGVYPSGTNNQRRLSELTAHSLFKQTRSVVFFAAVAGLSTACRTHAPEATNIEPLVVGNSPWPGFVAQFVAEEKGFYEEAGVEVEERHFQVSTDVNAAIASNQMDIAWTGVSDVVAMADETPSLRLIAVSDYSDGVDGILAEGVSSPSDLIGKTIAWEGLPLQTLLLQAYLKGTDIDIKDLDLRVIPAAESATAFAAGRLDAVVTFEPYLTSAIAEGRGEVIFSSKDTNIIAGGLVGKKSTLENRREDIEAYMRALEKGLEFYERNPQEALSIVAEKLAVPVEMLDPIMNNVRLFRPSEHSVVVFDADNALNVIDSIEFAAEVGVEMGDISPSVDAASLYDNSYTQALY